MKNERFDQLLNGGFKYISEECDYNNIQNKREAKIKKDGIVASQEKEIYAHRGEIAKEYKKMKKPSFLKKMKMRWRLLNMFNYDWKNKTKKEKILFAIKHPKRMILLYKQSKDLQKRFLWLDASEKVLTNILTITPQAEIDERNLEVPKTKDDIERVMKENIKRLDIEQKAQTRKIKISEL